MKILWIALSILSILCIFALRFKNKYAGRAVGLLAFSIILGVSGAHVPSYPIPARETFLATVRAQDWVAEQSQDLKPYFWYSNSVPLTGEFCAISSTYLWGYSLVNDTMPTLQEKELTRLNFANRIVVMTDRMEHVDAAIQTLSKYGIHGRIKAQEQLKHGENTILLAMLDLYPSRLLCPKRNPDGKVLLESVINAEPPRSYPLQSCIEPINLAKIQSNYFKGDNAVRVFSTAQKDAEIATFGPFVAPETATYGFFMRYAYQSGQMKIQVKSKHRDPIEFSSDSQYARSGFINRIFMAPLQKGEVFYVVFESQTKYKPVELTLFDFWAWIS